MILSPKCVLGLVWSLGIYAEGGKQMLESFDTDQPMLNPFLLVTFADLKKYVYHYWFAFPALVSSPAWTVDGDFMPVGVSFHLQVSFL